MNTTKYIIIFIITCLGAIAAYKYSPEIKSFFNRKTEQKANNKSTCPAACNCGINCSCSPCTCGQ